MRKYDHVTTDESVAICESSGGVFEGILSEMRELSKKKPDATLNKNKVEIINRILRDLGSILGQEPEGKYLDLLDDDDLPQNSDAVLVMVQYETALSAFGRRYRGSIGGHRGWITKERISEYSSIEDEFDEDEFEL